MEQAILFRSFSDWGGERERKRTREREREKERRERDRQTDGQSNRMRGTISERLSLSLSPLFLEAILYLALNPKTSISGSLTLKQKI